uniref:Uncharacterized protein n=1 Tax=Micrurus surinamensis TaxID=129470 RepID=A0A2D4PAU8_MICSU
MELDTKSLYIRGVKLKARGPDPTPEGWVGCLDLARRAALETAKNQPAVPLPAKTELGRLRRLPVTHCQQKQSSPPKLRFYWQNAQATHRHPQHRVTSNWPRPPGPQGQTQP